MTRLGLRRTIALWLAHWLKEWVERFIARAGEAGAQARRPGEPADAPPPAPAERPFEEPESLPLDAGAALVEWIATIRDGAPELLAGAARRWPEAYRQAMARPRAAPPPDEPGAERPRAAAPPPGAGHGAPAAPPAPPISSHDAHGAHGDGHAAPPAVEPGPPALALNPRPPAAAAGPSPHAATPPGVLRWSERVRRRAELGTTHSRRSAPRPAFRPEPQPGTETAQSPEREAPERGVPEPLPPEPRPGLDPPRWPAPGQPAAEALPIGGGAETGRWPELPADDEAPAEQGDDLARRLERRQRIELEQRGE